MKTNKKHKFRQSVIVMITILAIIVLSSCRKDVEIDPPTTLLVTTNVFKNDNTAISAQLGVYAQLATSISIPFYVNKFTGLSSDELVPFATDQLTRDLYLNKLVATPDGATLNAYVATYNYIYQEYAIIENLQDNKNVGTAVAKHLIGEAKFIRAYLYFYLTNLYGDVPIVLTTDYTVTSVLSKSNPTQVYQQIIVDLLAAKDLLSDTYLDQTDLVITTERVRPVKAAASALLARVYSFMGNNDAGAINESSQVINNTANYSLVGLDQVFLKNSNEAILQFQPDDSKGYTPMGNAFVLTTVPSAAKSSIILNDRLLNAFEIGDNRRTHWVNTFTSGASNWYYPYKYKAGATAVAPLKEYIMILRLGEQYLIRAEAYAKQNNLSGAISDLNKIRTRAGLPPLVSALSQAQVLVAVAQEKRIELFSEGQRWIELKKSGTIDAVMGGPTGATQAKGGSWNSYQQLYPIVVSETLVNPKITQNNGY